MSCTKMGALALTIFSYLPFGAFYAYSCQQCDLNALWNIIMILHSLGKLPMSYNLDTVGAKAFCACSRCGWGLFGHFYSPLSFLSSFSLFLEDGPIKTENTVSPLNQKQPTNFTVM